MPICILLIILYNNKNIELSWLSGIMPAELMAADELSYSSAYVALNGGLESLTQSSVSDVPFEKHDYANTDWFAIRNKYFSVIIHNLTCDRHSKIQY